MKPQSVSQALQQLDSARKNITAGHSGRMTAATIADVHEFFRAEAEAKPDDLKTRLKSTAKDIGAASDEEFTDSGAEVKSLLRAVGDKIFIDVRNSTKSRPLKRNSAGCSPLHREPDAAFARWCAIGSIYCALQNKRDPFHHRPREKVATHYRGGTSIYDVVAIFNDPNDTGFGSEHGKTVNIMGR